MKGMPPTFILAIALATLGTLMSSATAFVPCDPSVLTTQTTTRQFHSHLTAETMSSQDLTEPEQRVYSLVKNLHDSGFSFRIVVVGNGAILETTSPLGPVMKLSASPKTGKALLTLASEDQSFEFHVSPSDTAKIVLTERDAGAKVLRVIRFLNSDGAPMCSFILGDGSLEAETWYEKLRSTYGEEIQL